MTGNIVGEEFEKYVFDQIAQRQKDQFSGYDSLRTSDQLQYLNNKTAWVKLASGMEIVQEEKSGFNGMERLREILGDNDLAEQFRGTLLAQKTILFNGTSQLNISETDNEIKSLGYTSRSGYNKTQSIWDLTSAYGLGGPDFGQQPMPGITSVTVKSLNRGSIKEANLQIKAYNKFQFAILELLYLRIGFTMMLEWGNDKYISSLEETKDQILETGNTIIEDHWFKEKNYNQLSMLEEIEGYRAKYEGNYDGFFGKVVNFTWTFNSDGSYDIDLKLITVGDIVESFQANVPVNSEQLKAINSTLKEEDDRFEDLLESPLVKSAQNNVIGKYLFETITSENFNELFDGEDYYSMRKSLYKDGLRSNTSTYDSESNKKSTYKPYEQYTYYIRFGEFLRIFEDKVICGIKLDEDNIQSMITIDKDEETNVISWHLNQISLDPRVCIFKYTLGDFGIPGFGISGVGVPKYILSLKKDYLDTREDNVIFGKLMNLYLNYDFINKCLTESSGDDGISVYKFFQKVCNGINSALGGVNNLEPILKKDKILTFIDQSPIPGYVESLESKTDIVDLEVYGYNTSKKESNFVKDISFKTQITPQLASMISIGTTAGGSSTKEDGTAFSYWNQGLRDRYSPEILDPSEKATGPKTKEEKEQEKKEERLANFADTWNKKSIYVVFGSEDKGGKDSDFELIDSELWGSKRRRRSITDGAISGGYSIREFINLKEELYQQAASRGDLITSDQLADFKQQNYAFYLTEAFGGETNIKVQSKIWNQKSRTYTIGEKLIKGRSINSSMYHFFDSDFIAKGKSAYKSYIKSLENEIYNSEIDEETRERSPSNTIGFIPVGFDITLEGISGIKIYNKLNINNTFLPNNYPEALKFLIQKVDHKIQDNNWETNLDTLSIPNVRPSAKADFTDLNRQIKEGLLPKVRRGPETVPTGKSLATYINYNGIRYSGDREGIIAQLNYDAREAFRNFFAEFVSEWDAYTMNINALGRSIERSKELKLENPKNADPGKSKHNYYAAIDCNIVTPSGKTLVKGDPIPWINHGFDALAAKHGLIWGGNFSNYVDCVHFAYDFNINTAINNAIERYGSLENMRDDDGKNVKLT